MTRLVSLMAGAKVGGAEAFFERLVVALQANGIEQRVAIRADADRKSRLRAKGVDPVALSFGGVFDLATPWRLKSLFDDFNAEVALAFMSRAAAKLPPKALTKSRPAYVGRLGGYYDLKYYRRCDHLIGNTRDICDWIVKQGWPAARVDYLPNFVDATPVVPASREGADKIVLALGRLHTNKAFDVAIAAMENVPNAQLWIAGAGPLDGELKAQAAKLGDRVRFLGWRADSTALIEACDVLVCPSRHEPLGNVVIEAWARGKPVVAAASQGPGALIRDGKDGLLVPIDDAISLSQALNRVLAERALADDLGAAGQARHAGEFGEAKVIGAYKDFIARAAKEYR
ncbi:MAG: glycosyltransferase [Alphaproteobacteria bacterium]|nr:glycosyltransferase [Alphaproteobacteria bacterium]